jgi:hypothetical protein
MQVSHHLHASVFEAKPSAIVAATTLQGRLPAWEIHPPHSKVFHLGQGCGIPLIAKCAMSGAPSREANRGPMVVSTG